jgi:TnpA family transposase
MQKRRDDRGVFLTSTPMHRRGQTPPGRCRRYALLADRPKADYGLLNSVSELNISIQKIEPRWDDMLRLAASLKLGRVSAVGIMRTLQVGARPSCGTRAIWRPH